MRWTRYTRSPAPGRDVERERCDGRLGRARARAGVGNQGESDVTYVDGVVVVERCERERAAVEVEFACLSHLQIAGAQRGGRAVLESIASWRVPWVPSNMLAGIPWMSVTPLYELSELPSSSRPLVSPITTPPGPLIAPV